MTDIERIIDRLQTNFDGTAWHGTPLRRMMDGITDEQAAARPIANARTIAELLAHTIAWIDIVERRMRGEVFEITPELDFPDPGGVPWSQLLARLDDAFSRLLASVRRLQSLGETVAGKNYTIEFMLDGVMHHNTYHAAQIAILKKF